MSISSNLGTFFRAGVFAAATSGGWAAATHYGKEWNQVEAHENFSTDNNRAFQFSQTSIRGFGDFMSNPGLDHLTHFSLSPAAQTWLDRESEFQMQWIRQANGRSASAGCLSFLRHINETLQSGESDGIKIYHLDVAGKMARGRLESLRVNRPATNMIDAELPAVIERLHIRGAERILEKRSWKDYADSEYGLLTLLGAALIFLGKKNDDRHLSWLKELGRTLKEAPQAHLSSRDSKRLLAAIVPYRFVGTCLAITAGVLSVHQIDAQQHAHAPIGRGACLVEDGPQRNQSNQPAPSQPRTSPRRPRNTLGSRYDTDGI